MTELKQQEWEGLNAKLGAELAQAEARVKAVSGRSLRYAVAAAVVIVVTIVLAFIFKPSDEQAVYFMPDVAAAFVKHLPGARGPNAQHMWTLTFGFVHRIGMLVAEGQSTGEIARDIEPFGAAQNVFALYFAALMSWLNGHVTLEAALDPLLRNALALQVRGLRP
jgi:hypothetical protein